MNGNGNEEKPDQESRLGDLEAAYRLMISDHEEFRQEHKRLLTAQVLLVDAQQKLVDAQRESEKKIAALAEKQDRTSVELREMSKKTDERIAAMTSAIGELIRRMPLPPEAGAPQSGAQ